MTNGFSLRGNLWVCGSLLITRHFRPGSAVISDGHLMILLIPISSRNAKWQVGFCYHSSPRGMGRMVTGSIKDLVKIRCTLLIEGKENHVLVGGSDDATMLDGIFSITFSSRCAGVPVH